MKIYLAGPMRGLPQWNYPAFAAAKKVLEAHGHHVFCPATLATAMGYHAETPCEPGNGDAHLRHVILSDVCCLLHADAIALLRGWEKSRGATVELALAQFLGIEIWIQQPMNSTGEQNFKGYDGNNCPISLTPWAALIGPPQPHKCKIFNPLLRD